MMKPDPAALQGLDENTRRGLMKALESADAEMQLHAASGCNDTAWSEDRRRCIAAATTPTAVQACN
jgi:hypothetical protein